MKGSDPIIRRFLLLPSYGICLRELIVYSNIPTGNNNNLLHCAFVKANIK